MGKPLPEDRYLSINQRPAISKKAASAIGKYLVIARAPERWSRWSNGARAIPCWASLLQTGRTRFALLAAHKEHLPITARSLLTMPRSVEQAAVYFAQPCLAATQREHQRADSPVCAQRHGPRYVVGGAGIMDRLRPRIWHFKRPMKYYATKQECNLNIVTLRNPRSLYSIIES